MQINLVAGKLIMLHKWMSPVTKVVYEYPKNAWLITNTISKGETDVPSLWCISSNLNKKHVDIVIFLNFQDDIGKHDTQEIKQTDYFHFYYLQNLWFSFQNLEL